MSDQDRLQRLRKRAIAAMKEFDELGEKAFLNRYRYGRSKKFDLIYNGRTYPPKAIWGLTLHSSTEPHQRPSWLHGGEQTNRRLRELSFNVVPKDEIGTLTEREIGKLPSRQEDYIVQTGIRYRRGQHKFRKALLEAYEGRCAITRSRTESLLDAAHVLPYSELGEYAVNNGILLRTDVHTLFDLGLLRIDPSTLRIDINPVVSENCYRELHGRKIAQPKLKANQIKNDHLEARWQLLE